MMELSETAAKYARTDEDRLLLRRVLDKLDACDKKSIPTSTCFLNERERDMCAEMLARSFPGARYVFDGGYAGAERAVLAFLPEWQYEEDMERPVRAVRAVFSGQEELTHRDFLGALMGAGIKRETVGDILASRGQCDIVLLPEVLPYVLQNLDSAGRVKLCVEETELSLLSSPEQETRTIRDTVASPRLDSIVSAGFSMSRDKAAALVRSGKVSLSHQPCDKPDREVKQGDVVSARGLGRLEVSELGGASKKGRVFVTLKRFI